MLTVKVLIFGALAEALGQRQVELQLRDNATVTDAIDEIARRWPKLSHTRDRLAAAVNQCYVGADTPLREADELALIPPVSGG